MDPSKWKYAIKDPIIKIFNAEMWANENANKPGFSIVRFLRNCMVIFISLPFYMAIIIINVLVLWPLTGIKKIEWGDKLLKEIEDSDAYKDTIVQADMNVLSGIADRRTELTKAQIEDRRRKRIALEAKQKIKDKQDDDANPLD